MSIYDGLLSLKEACDLTGASETTLRKYLGLGKNAGASRLPNARKVIRNNKEIWEIPVSDLHNAGLMKDTIPAAEPQATPASPEPSIFESYAVMKAENEALKKLIVVLEANLADLRGIYRALENPNAQKERRKFWQR
jgi:hypothetical protein